MASGTGGCLCGAVRYRLAEAPTRYGACHCGLCRRWSGGIELGIETMPDAIVWEGEGTVRTYKSSDWAERGFCGTCGSNLFWRLTIDGPMYGLLSLAAGSLDDFSGMTFDSEIYVDHQPESHAFAGERKRMTEAEVLEMVGASAP